jgi:hypothetical protein
VRPTSMAQEVAASGCGRGEPPGSCERGEAVMLCECGKPAASCEQLRRGEATVSGAGSGCASREGHVAYFPFFPLLQ